MYLCEIKKNRMDTFDGHTPSLSPGIKIVPVDRLPVLTGRNIHFGDYNALKSSTSA